MITDIINNDNYKDLVVGQIRETIQYLLDNNQYFSITANIEPVAFKPELPEVIMEQMPKYTLFILENYTYTTVEISGDYLLFEAGFGSENFGSHVKVPLQSIFQIVVDESILYINTVATVEKYNKNPKHKSMNIFKNNPNNKKFN